MSTIRDIISYLETIAPPGYQEDYDNAGLITGNPSAGVNGVLTCLDATEAVIREAIERGCNLVVTHHPIVFKGLKRLTGATYVERVIIEAIRHDIAIYAIHTNLDNVYHQGVNGEIARRLGLIHTQTLVPKAEWQQVRFLFPEEQLPDLKNQLHITGYGELISCIRTEEGPLLCEIRFDRARQKHVQAILKSLSANALERAVWQSALHPHPEIGAGMIGELPEAMSEKAFLEMLKTQMQVSCIRHTSFLQKMIRKVAVCGGAGSSMLRHAIGQGADIYVSADFKYHEFFDADSRILIADIGHYESEQFTIQLLQKIISQKFSNFAAYCAEAVTNPVFYF